MKTPQLASAQVWDLAAWPDTKAALAVPAVGLSLLFCQLLMVKSYPNLNRLTRAGGAFSTAGGQVGSTQEFVLVA